MIFDVPTLLSTLKELVGELETRKEELRYSGCRNIHQYNTEIRDTFRRIIFGCDEVAELLDPTGRSKADKEQIEIIKGYLATLARQGRAMGIHLLLATQRPDVKVMDGQIKNNIDCRICGRADLILSQIILDNGSAAEISPAFLLPKSRKMFPDALFVTWMVGLSFKAMLFPILEVVERDGISYY